MLSGVNTQKPVPVKLITSEIATQITVANTIPFKNPKYCNALCVYSLFKSIDFSSKAKYFVLFLSYIFIFVILVMYLGNNFIIKNIS